MREKAISIIEKNNPWGKFNPIFKNFISYIDEVCNKGGLRINIDYYVEREDGFEYNYVSSLIDKHDDQNVQKIQIISGKVGSGKTAFCDYIRNKILPQQYPHIIPFYIDLTTLPANDDKEYILELVEQRIYLTIESTLLKSIFNNNQKLFKEAYVESLGYDISLLSSSEIIKNFREDLEKLEKTEKLKKILRFLDYILPKISISKICLIIDNVDENRRETVSNIRYSIRELNRFFTDYINNISTILLVPVREYNVHLYCQYFHTMHNEPTELRPVSIGSVCVAKFTELRDKIRNSISEYKFPYDSPYTSQTSPELYTSVTKERIIEFLELFIKNIFSNSDNVIVRILKELSAGNLKYLVGNIFNMLNSPFLPIDNIIYKAHSPIHEYFKVNRLLSCLMAVHYPFYSSSLILNLFNSSDSNVDSDFQNTLIMIRILNFIEYYQEIDLDRIRKDFYRKGYHERYVNDGLERIYNFGLLEASNGALFKHLDSKTVVSLSSAGKSYLHHLVFKSHYLMFVSETTPLDKDSMVSPRSKYVLPGISANERKLMEARLSSVRRFITFIERNEHIERRALSLTKEKDYREFLNIYGFRINGEGKSIVENQKFKNEVIFSNLNKLDIQSKPNSPASNT